MCENCFAAALLRTTWMVLLKPSWLTVWKRVCFLVLVTRCVWFASSENNRRMACESNSLSFSVFYGSPDAALSSHRAHLMIQLRLFSLSFILLICSVASHVSDASLLQLCVRAPSQQDRPSTAAWLSSRHKILQKVISLKLHMLFI